MSLMGLIMMLLVVSNSILIVEFTNRLRAEGKTVREAVALACKVRLRPGLDDVAGHVDWPHSHGPETGHGRCMGPRPSPRPLSAAWRSLWY